MRHVVVALFLQLSGCHCHTAAKKMHPFPPYQNQQKVIGINQEIKSDKARVCSTGYGKQMPTFLNSSRPLFFRSKINKIKEQSTGLPLSRQKKIPNFSRQNCGQLYRTKCTFINPNSPWTRHMKNEIHSTNEVQVSYFVELPQSKFPHYTNSPTFPRLFPPNLGPFLDFPDFRPFRRPFPDLSLIPRHFQVSAKFH